MTGGPSNQADIDRLHAFGEEIGHLADDARAALEMLQGYASDPLQVGSGIYGSMITRYFQGLIDEKSMPDIGKIIVRLEETTQRLSQSCGAWDESERTAAQQFPQ